MSEPITKECSIFVTHVHPEDNWNNEWGWHFRIPVEASVLTCTTPASEEDSILVFYLIEDT